MATLRPRQTQVLSRHPMTPNSPELQLEAIAIEHPHWMQHELASRLIHATDGKQAIGHEATTVDSGRLPGRPSRFACRSQLHDIEK